MGEHLKSIGKHNRCSVSLILPLLQAFADKQIMVEKQIEGDRSKTVVNEVTGAERVKEIARMLSGDSKEDFKDTCRGTA